MDSLSCPKCRRALPEDALDAGQCPLCGFPLDGPVLLAAPGSHAGSKLLLFALGGVVLLAGVVTVYAVSDRSDPPPELVLTKPAIRPEPATEAAPVTHIAPFPHAPKPSDASATNPPAPGAEPPGPKGDQGQPPVPVPAPVPVVNPPKKDGPRPIGVVMKVDPKIAPKRHFDHPDDTAAVPDLNTGDRVTLTGKVRVLKLGSVNGKGVLDASGLVAEEVVITGDLNSEAQVSVNAPNGTVMVGGYVTGTAKLTIAAPGGEVIVAGSGRLSGGPLVTVTAKRLEVKCPMSGNARINATLTAGGSLKLTLTEENATVSYKKAAAKDPPLTVEKGVTRGRGLVIMTD
jgi:hypothetical protein